MTKNTTAGASWYRLERDEDFDVTPKITTKDFTFDAKSNTFSSDSERLHLQLNERFEIFLMRGKYHNHTFIYSGTELADDGSVIDLYEVVSIDKENKVDYKAKIQRKIS